MGWEAIKDSIFNMILISWGTFFTDISNHIEKYQKENECNQVYNSFLKKLCEWIPKDCKSEQEAFARISVKETRFKSKYFKIADFGV